MEEVPAFIRREEIADFADGLDELIEGPGSDAPEVRLEFREGHFDRVEIRTAGRQEQEVAPMGLEHPRKPIADYQLHLRVTGIVLRLQDQRPEHRHRVKRRTPAPGTIAVTRAINQPDTKIFKIHRSLRNFKWITMLADLLKMIIKTEKTIGMHDPTSLAEVNHKSATMGRLLRVSISMPTGATASSGHGSSPTSPTMTDAYWAGFWIRRTPARLSGRTRRIGRRRTRRKSPEPGLEGPFPPPAQEADARASREG